jgi:hypothetical protein
LKSSGRRKTMKMNSDILSEVSTVVEQQGRNLEVSTDLKTGRRL